MVAAPDSLARRCSCERDRKSNPKLSLSVRGDKDKHSFGDGLLSRVGGDIRRAGKRVRVGGVQMLFLLFFSRSRRRGYRGDAGLGDLLAGVGVAAHLMGGMGFMQIMRLAARNA